MFLSEQELARIPICPRAKLVRPVTKPIRILVATDAAVMAVARMIVAGVDKKYCIHPEYHKILRVYGKSKAQELIEHAVTIPGACDIMQTDPRYAGLGLFGGLSKDKKQFVFYEWTETFYGKLRLTMTVEEARNIVSGEKKSVIFRPKRYQLRYIVDLWPLKKIYVKNQGSWIVPWEAISTLKIHGQAFRFRSRVYGSREVVGLYRIELASEDQKKVLKAIRQDKTWRAVSRDKVDQVL